MIFYVAKSDLKYPDHLLDYIVDIIVAQLLEKMTDLVHTLTFSSRLAQCSTSDQRKSYFWMFANVLSQPTQVHLQYVQIGGYICQLLAEEVKKV